MVTVTYGAADVLPQMLDALPVAELAGVVVVDNFGEPELTTVVEGCRERNGHIELLSPGENLGFGRGNNLGANAAPSSAWLLFLNPDAVLARDALVALLAYAAEHPEAAVIGPRVIDRDRPLTSGGSVATWLTELRHTGPPVIRTLFPERRLSPEHSLSGVVGYVEGGCMLVDRAAFDAVGGFDERFFLYYEESDLGRAVARLGRQVHLCATATVQHAPGTERRRGSVTQQAELLRSAGRYIEKWDGRWRATAFRAAARLRLLAQLAGRRLTRSDYRLISAALSDRTA